MALTFRHGNLFNVGASVLVNPVNCKGAMGRGVALEVKRRWPATYAAYRVECNAGRLRPGTLFSHVVGDLFDCPHAIWNVATKDHWKGASNLHWIEMSIRSIAEAIDRQNPKSVAIPALGCGKGGLDWRDVKPLFEAILKSRCDRSDVTVIEPPQSKGCGHGRDL